MSVWAAASVRRKRRRRAAGLLLRSLRGAVMRRVMAAWEDHTEEAARREKRCVRPWLWRWLWRWLCVMVCADGAPVLLCCRLSEAIHNWQLGALRVCWDVLSTNVRLSREAKLRLGKADDHFRRLRLSQAVQCLSLHARRRRATREVGVALRAVEWCLLVGHSLMLLVCCGYGVCVWALLGVGCWVFGATASCASGWLAPHVETTRGVACLAAVPSPPPSTAFEMASGCSTR